MPEIDTLTLEDLQDYARQYFPDEFSKLPTIDKLHFEAHQVTPLKYSPTIKLLPTRLLLGTGTSSVQKWAYCDVNGCSVMFTSENQRYRRSIDDMRWESKDLSPPFCYTSSVFKNGGTCFLGGAEEMKIFIEYIFLLKGLLISVRRLSYTLIMFERACKAVAKKSAVSINHFPISIMASWEKAIVQKMLSCWKSRGARSIQVQPEPVNALSGSSSTTPSFTVSGKSLGSKRSIGDATNGDSTQEVPSQRKEAHMNLMRNMFKEREAERMKPIEDIKALRVEKNDLIPKNNQLKDQIAEEQKSRLEADEKVLNLANGLAKEKRERVETTNSNARLQKEIQTEKGLRVKVETKMKNDRTHMDSVLKKARDLYKCHKELLEMHSMGYTPEKRGAIFQALAKDFGELCGEKGPE